MEIRVTRLRRYNRIVISKAQWELRERQWAEYRRWAEAQPPLPAATEESIADVGTILEWIPEAARSEDRDPERSGVRRMHYLLGLLPWPLERQAIEQAVERNVAGVTVRVAGINYLLLLKLISERPKDRADASALFRRHRDRVDLVWLEKELAALSDALAQPEMLQRFHSMVEGK